MWYTQQVNLIFKKSITHNYFDILKQRDIRPCDNHQKLSYVLFLSNIWKPISFQPSSPPPRASKFLKVFKSKVRHSWCSPEGRRDRMWHWVWGGSKHMCARVGGPCMFLRVGPPPQSCTANSGYKGNEEHTHTHTHTHTKGQPLNQEKKLSRG